MSPSRYVMRGVPVGRTPLVLVTRPCPPAAVPGRDSGSGPEGYPPPPDPEAELARARAEAEALLARARAEAEEIARRAREEGYARGLEEARAAMEGELAAAREKARAILQAAEDLRRETLAALDGDIRALALDIAQQAVARQLSLDPGTVEAIAREAIRLVRDREQVILFAHPEDAVLLRERAEELRALLAPQAVFRIVEDAGLTRGGCLVDTGEGLVDARMESRWQVLREVLES